MTNNTDRISAESLERLDSGCYVRVQKQHDCCWVEIVDKNEQGFCGTIHPELSEAGCQSANPAGNTRFHAGQIVELGCDRFCWC